VTDARHQPPGDRLSRALRTFVAGLLILAMAGRAGAEGLSGHLELGYSKLDRITEDAAGQRTDTESETFRQRYTLTLDRRIYPNLTLVASGFFERLAAAAETDGTESDTTTTKLRPYVELRLRTPLYLAQAAYSRTEEKLDSPGTFDLETVRETYSSTLHWRPDGFPDLRLQYFRTNHYDRDRQFTDRTNDLFQATSVYRPVEPLLLRYEGVLRETDNRVEDFEIREASHAGRVTYSDTYWRGLVSVYSDYNVVRRETEIAAGAGAEISLIVAAFGGLSALDDTPEEGALDPNPALIDGDLAAGAGIDLGLPPPGGDTRARNLGLRFAVETEVNTLLVWVDRELPPEIAASFSWRVYTSDDNQDWNLRAAASPAVFDPLFNRFEVRFPTVAERFVKVVVDPLSPTVDPTREFPTIPVTELQAAIRRPAAEVAGEQVRTSHLYNLDVRTRILEVPALTYEFTFFLAKTEPSPTVWTMSNGLSASHRFRPTLFGGARVAREDGREAAGDRVAYLYSASLTAVPLETLRSTLVFSGRNETVDGRESDDVSLFLQSVAQLYRGVDLNLGGGVSFATSETGRDTTSTQLNADLTLVPNPKATINLSYYGRTSRSSGGELAGTTTDRTQIGIAALSLRPLRTLYLFGAWTVESRSEEDTRTTQDYTVSFSPFPDGTLHLNFYYNETLRSEDDARERTVTPNLRWNIARRTTLDLAYSDVSIRSDVLRRDDQVASGTLRVSF
jgi:hypothetical protein